MQSGEDEAQCGRDANRIQPVKNWAIITQNMIFQYRGGSPIHSKNLRPPPGKFVTPERATLALVNSRVHAELNEK